ncbi:hypothetical protein FYK55_04170 [Roseiconus nitratireducens]|uniref:Uncharacterized protein n=2 Tax=Roseiconus nitratireducens TaxID=2605748 RepID=A0A5M6DIT7_9BACT|nr:hypothetical protein FYK55_04170 [Roseiconus nitratireducens]
MIALLLGLISVTAAAEPADDSGSVDSESLWVTSIVPGGGDSFVVGTATGLLLRPGTVSRVKLANTGQLEKLYEHPAAVWDVAATDDANTIASVDYRGNLIVYDVASKTPTTHESVFERWCQTLVMGPDDKTVLAGNESGKLFSFDLAKGELAKTVELSEAAITDLAVSPDATKVAATDGAGKVHLLKWPELDSIGVISISDETAWCLSFTQDSESLVVGSADRNLYQVRAAPDAKPESIAQGTDWITRIAVSPSGQIAASEVSGKIHFADGSKLTTIGAESGVWALCFGGPGQLLVGTRKNGIVTAGQSWTWNPAVTTTATPAADESAEKDEAVDDAGQEEAAAAEVEEEASKPDQESP